MTDAEPGWRGARHDPEKRRLPRPPSSFDVAVVGAGTAGLTAALAACHEGARVALVEREGRLGGDCTYYGCVPSKALIDVAQAAADAGELVRAGVMVGEPRLDFAAVRERQRRIVAEVAADERVERFSARGIEVIHGAARFVDAHRVLVGEREIRARRFVIATGTAPATPAVPGLDAVPYLTSRTIFDLEALPGRMLVAGAGAIGLELAQAFSRFGSHVTVVEQLEKLLPQHDPEVGALVERSLRREGVDLRLGHRIRRASRRGNEVALDLDGETVLGDVLLVATGRTATTAGLGLEAIGVETERGFVRVDERCRTSVANVFAAGDVTGGSILTHVAAHEGAVAGRNAVGKRAKRDLRVVPSVVFVDPEVASVGLCEREARERHGAGAVRAVAFPMTRVDRARIAGRSEGFVKLVSAKRRLLGWAGGGRLVGAQIVGRGAGELIHECALAMRVDAFAGRLAQTIHAYPTMSVGVQQAASRLFPLGRALVEGDDDGDRQRL